jgi:hypothetical protein
MTQPKVFTLVNPRVVRFHSQSGDGASDDKHNHVAVVAKSSHAAAEVIGEELMKNVQNTGHVKFLITVESSKGEATAFAIDRTSDDDGAKTTTTKYVIPHHQSMMGGGNWGTPVTATDLAMSVAPSTAATGQSGGGFKENWHRQRRRKKRKEKKKKKKKKTTTHKGTGNRPHHQLRHNTSSFNSRGNDSDSDSSSSSSSSSESTTTDSDCGLLGSRYNSRHEPNLYIYDPLLYNNLDYSSFILGKNLLFPNLVSPLGGLIVTRGLDGHNTVYVLPQKQNSATKTGSGEGKGQG